MTDIVDRAKKWLGKPPQSIAPTPAQIVRDLLAEVERLRAGGPWIEHLERERAMKRQRDGDCICDGNPETTYGPDEFCPWHGMPYRELVEIIVRQQAQLNEGRVTDE
jgi:hypothetical protein